MRWRSLLSVLTAVVGAVAISVVSVAPAVASEGCGNEARRQEQHAAYLPDCRAYELVTPASKDSSEPKGVLAGLETASTAQPQPVTGAHAAVNGDRMAWYSEYSVPNVAGESPGVDFLSTRTEQGWSTENLVPPQSREIGAACVNFPGVVGWAPNLERGVLADGMDQQSAVPGQSTYFYEEQGECGHDEPRLVAGEPETPFPNLFVREGTTPASYQLVNVTPSDAPVPTAKEPNQPHFPASFLAASESLTHVVFEDELPLTEGAERLTPEVEAGCKEQPKGRACWEGHDDVYVWSEGTVPAVKLVTALPDGKPVQGRLAGSTRNGAGAPFAPNNIADYRHAVSADGSRIFFEAEGNLYVRENAAAPQSALGSHGECAEPARACTLELDLPQGGLGSGGGRWVGANAEGTKTFFTDEAPLTANAVAASGPNLYEYQLPTAADTRGSLVDLTPNAKAEVLGMSGTSEDGGYVYFVAQGALTGAQQNSQHATAVTGRPNLYLAHEARLTFIATLAAEDLCDWTASGGCNLVDPAIPVGSGLTARVSANGGYVGFDSTRAVTGYDNTGPSCVPSYKEGVGFTGYAAGRCDEIYVFDAAGNALACASCNPSGPPVNHGAAIAWPAEVDGFGQQRGAYPQRNVSDAGQVFFETSEPLVRQDVNAQRDVYEYEAGQGVRLISSGTSPTASRFLDATPSGSDVFFASAQKLLARDTESAYQIYDARVGGGFPEPPEPAAPCESPTECKGLAGLAPPFSAPGSTTFSGDGNVERPKAVSVPKAKETSAAKRRGRLRRALAKCVLRYRHKPRKRMTCKRRVRRRFGHRATAGRHRHRQRERAGHREKQRGRNGRGGRR